MKRNPIAKRDVELERLKLSLARNFVTPDAQAAFQVPIVFAGLLVLAALGIVLYAATASIEKRFTRWAFRGQANH